MPSERPILLTGAASGIGRASTQALAAKGHALALIDVNPDMLNEVVGSCQKSSAQMRGFTCDVTDEAAVRRTWQQIRSEFGGAGTLINCAGIGRFAPFLDLEPAEWLRMFNVNVMGAVHMTRAVLPDMLAAGEGLIINVSSRMALDPHPNTTAYAASKGAIHASRRRWLWK
jgi:NAD(P)-dependent dehydrogenase (short-subunit alcohol dehydrogenase family)